MVKALLLFSRASDSPPSCKCRRVLGSRTLGRGESRRECWIPVSHSSALKPVDCLRFGDSHQSVCPHLSVVPRGTVLVRSLTALGIESCWHLQRLLYVQWMYMITTIMCHYHRTGRAFMIKYTPVCNIYIIATIDTYERKVFAFCGDIIEHTIAMMLYREWVLWPRDARRNKRQFVKP